MKKKKSLKKPRPIIKAPAIPNKPITVIFNF